MMTRLLAAAVLVAGVSQVALAQGTSSNTGSGNQSSAQSGTQSGTQAAQSLPAELRQQLTDAGFTNVKIVPSSFVVQAQDKQGHPVLMQISPNSMTMLTSVPANSGSTTGSGSSNSSSGSGSSGSSSNSSNR